MAYWREDRGKWAIRVRMPGRTRATIQLVDARDAEHAERIRAALQARAEKAGTTPGLARDGRAKLRELVDPWMKIRKTRGVRTAKNEHAHLVNHVLPTLGEMAVADVEPWHVIEVLDALKASEKASRSIRNVATSARCLWDELVERKVVTSNPWAAARKHLPKIVDSDSAWRDEAWFRAEEVELLISSPEIPPDRRMVNALIFLSGMRVGECFGLKWKHYDPTAQPLGRFTLSHNYLGPSKTDRARHAPVHPTLAAMLAEWRLTHWPRLYGRTPGPDDLIVPGPAAQVSQANPEPPVLDVNATPSKRPMWHDSNFRKRFYEDLAKLGLPVLVGNGKRGRSPHCARATFLTLGVDDGARLEVLDRAVHTVGKGSTAERHYLRTFWPTLCAEVSKLRIRRLPEAVCQSVAARVNHSLDCSQIAPRTEADGESQEISASYGVPEEGVEPSQGRSLGGF